MAKDFGDSVSHIALSLPQQTRRFVTSPNIRGLNVNGQEMFLVSTTGAASIWSNFRVPATFVSMTFGEPGVERIVALPELM